MRNVIASWKRHGEHELTDDGRKNLQRHERPRDNPPDPDVACP
jgi:hypothetical protein